MKTKPIDVFFLPVFGFLTALRFSASEDGLDILICFVVADVDDFCVFICDGALIEYILVRFTCV